MRPEALYLDDMLEAARGISRFLTGVEREDFLRDELRQKAVLMNLVMIGEAASKVGPATRAEFPEIPWRDMVGFRNFAVHVYFAVKWEIVWRTVVEDIPVLTTALALACARISSEEG